MMRKGAVNGMIPSPRQISGDPTDHPVYTPLAQPVVKRKKKRFLAGSPFRSNRVSAVQHSLHDNLEYEPLDVYDPEPEPDYAEPYDPLPDFATDDKFLIQKAPPIRASRPPRRP